MLESATRNSSGVLAMKSPGPTSTSSLRVTGWRLAGMK